MNCAVCGSASRKVFKNIVLNKYNVSYFLCSNCGFHFAEKPYWLQESYENIINRKDFGIMERNLKNMKYIFSYLFMNNDFDSYHNGRRYHMTENVRLVDYGGGHGVLTRLLRDSGIDAWWTDKYAENIFALGYEADKNNYKYLTMFEVMEHVVEPADEIKKVVELYNPETIFFSTMLYGKKGVLPQRDWWYYIYDIGQHISFYCTDSLKYIGDLIGYNFYTNGIDFHCYSKNNKFEKILKYKEKKIIKLYDRYSGRVDALQ